MPLVRRQNALADISGNGIKNFSPVLPKVQAREHHQRQKFYHRNQPASQTLRRSADRKADHVLRLIFERNASGRLRDRYLYRPPEAEQRLTRVLLKIQADKIIDKR